MIRDPRFAVVPLSMDELVAWVQTIGWKVQVSPDGYCLDIINRIMFISEDSYKRIFDDVQGSIHSKE